MLMWKLNAKCFTSVEGAIMYLAASSTALSVLMVLSFTSSISPVIGGTMWTARWLLISMILTKILEMNHQFPFMNNNSISRFQLLMCFLLHLIRVMGYDYFIAIYLQFIYLCIFLFGNIFQMVLNECKWTLSLKHKDQLFRFRSHRHRPHN